MHLVDEVKIKAVAGKGGDGVIRWRHEKFEPKGGPAGGDGGRGGSVYFEAVRDPFLLASYTDKKVYKAENGMPGSDGKKKGKDGEDLVIKVPVGSKIINLSTDEEAELLEEGQKVKMLSGGEGGLGNDRFKSSRETTPYIATPGKIGEESEFLIELSLLADIGLVGFPNAGKSSLLNSITNANAKVGEYEFTTLEPNLGDMHGFVIADIPGLIEGASEGRGLGSKFLKHISHTRLIAHLVSCEAGMNMMKAYKEIRKELESYGRGLSEKDEIIILSKTDAFTDNKEIEKKVADFKKLGKPVFAVSLFDEESIKNLKDGLVKILEK
ncbi:GTPase ObgE [Candidatus Nomurabacteria bacterium]|nr:GTPase ObgE [Candidatus Nomurabacteria bacterium]USN94903.1 MAG: GTPase ObgE [Candidatus Nomurabacteria bacterium]